MSFFEKAKFDTLERCIHCGWGEHRHIGRFQDCPPHAIAYGSDPLAYSAKGATKETNPKDAIGDTKVPLRLLSPIAKIKWAMALFAGMLKYGAFNYIIAGARASIYISAMDRHMDAYKAGEDYDPTDGTDHLGNIMACCGILIDAREAKHLVDDRGPSLSHRAAVAEAEELMAKLKTQYADRNPRHYTIEDKV